ncbi:cupin domain-containing protein [Nocardioides guangzhouensis]|uniref:Cupin domain-containing protein n=1 Tax=Nocardioides guangzhouensis TaxID=2497878 RepID=A0A4Q4Z3L0_9ACTN|nr:AraC family ligand binding domain-containing protein [Nocardioides guangzhouensis]RYP81444.1 cupin domain-containing protein [Nocardioides guangzhouensis]
MPHASRDTAAESISLFGIDVRLTNLDGGYTVCFESHANDLDLGPLFDGLAGGVCHFIRLGYVIEGAVTFRIGERTETYSAGDAYLVPPGHVPIQHKGARLVEFSPTEELGQTIGVVMANVERGRTPLQLSSRK